MTGPRPKRVLLVASTGGHLEHLVQLRPWWSRHDRMWVTFDKADARSVLAGESIAWAHHPTTRNVPNLIRNFFVAVRVMRGYRPDLVISSGAGAAIPFFVLAKFFGVRTAFLEVYDRVESRTITGRVCHPLADLFLVQWASQQALYPGSVLVGELF